VFSILVNAVSTGKDRPLIAAKVQPVPLVFLFAMRAGATIMTLNISENSYRI
jgi:hypothetical protein